MLGTVSVLRHVGQSKLGTVVRLRTGRENQSESFFFFVAVLVSVVVEEVVDFLSLDLSLLLSDLPSESDLDFPLAASASALAAFL